jgi:uncharacterized protein involved in exopolysaccharide biosynthesis
MDPMDNSVKTGKQAVLVFVDELPPGPDATSLLKTLVAGWKLVAAFALLGAAIAITYCLVTPKWYRAQALVAPVRQDPSGSALGPLGGQIGGLASLVGLDIGDEEDQKKEAMARFESRQFNYEFLRSEGLIPVLFADKWDRARKQWKYPAKAPTLEDAYRFFVGRVASISEDRRTNLIKVTVNWTDPQLAQTWANQLVARINADRRAVARSETDRNLEFLDRELQRTGVVELRQAINRLVETEVRKRMLVNVREEYAFKVIDPAVVPGPHAVVRPRLAFTTAIAFLIGASLGAMIVLWRHWRRRSD